MHPRRFALIAGIIMLALGLFSLIPSLSNDYSGTLPALKVETSYGLFLGIFAMNIFNKVALILFGVAGIYASQIKDRSLPASQTYARWVLGAMGLLAILGLIPSTNTLGGYWPLFGNEVWAHALFAVTGAYFGYALWSKAKAKLPPAEAHDKFRAA